MADRLIAVLSQRADPSGKINAGKSYVIFGNTDNTAIDLSAIASGTGGFVINGESVGDWSGIPVSTAGDVNGDGLDDLIVGADIGFACVYFTAWIGSLSTNNQII
jgi:hypothetical protein